MPGTPTTKWGLPTMAGTDIANTIDEWTVAFGAAVDSKLAPPDQGVLASRPVSTVVSPGKSGRTYMATDLGVTFLDYGTGWLALNEPIGSVTWWAGAGAPAGGTHVEANGQAISRSAYPLYLSLVGTLHGAGDGSTTVNVPDLVGRTAVGRDPSATRIPNNPRAVGQAGGEERHTLTGAESGVNGNGTTGNDTPDHTHLQNNPNFVASVHFDNTGAHIATDTANKYADHPATGGASNRHAHPLNARNADSPHNNLQPYAVLTPIVRVA